MPVTVPSKMLGRLGSHGRWHVYSWSFNFMQLCISHKSLWLCDLHTEGFVQIKPFMISVVKLQYFIAFIQCNLISLRFKCYRFSWKLKSLSWYRGPVSSYCYNWNCPEIVLSFKNTFYLHCQFSSVQFSCSVLSDSLRPRESQYARPPCPSPTPGVHSNSHPWSRWWHPAISSPVVPFSSCPQSLPASQSFPMSQLFAWGGHSIGVSASASVLPMNTQAWSPLGWTGWISLQSKGLSRVFSNTTVQKHQFFGTQLSSQSNSNIHTWPLEKP